MHALVNPGVPWWTLVYPTRDKIRKRKWRSECDSITACLPAFDFSVYVTVKHLICERLMEHVARRHDSPETVDSLLRVVELDCWAGSQVQGANRFLKLEQKHITAWNLTQVRIVKSAESKVKAPWLSLNCPQSNRTGVSFWNVQTSKKKSIYIYVYLYRYRYICRYVCMYI